jgi:PAS domain S-box-containing protein
VFGILAAATGIAGIITARFGIILIGSANNRMIAFSAALIWIFLGSVLAYQAARPLKRVAGLAVQAVLALIAITGTLEFVFSVQGSHFIVENFFVNSGTIVFGSLSSPISPAALGFAVPSALMLILVIRSSGSPAKRPGVPDATGILGLAIVLASFTFLLSYAYGNPLPYGTQIIPIAFISALAAFFTGAALIAAAGPGAVPVRYIIGNSTGARLLRTFVPLVIALTLVENFVISGISDWFHLRDAVLSAATIVIFAFITAFVVGRVSGGLGRALERAEQELVRKNDELGAANEELTATQEELRQTNDELVVHERRLVQKNDELNVINEELTATQEELRQNIEELTKAEATLRESEERFRTIAEVSPVQLSIARRSDGGLLFTNPAYDRAFGFAPGELVGRRTPDLYFNPVDRETLLGFFREKGYVENHEVQVKRKDGTPFFINISLRAIRFRNEDAVIAASVDITRRKAAETGLVQKNDELNALNEELTATQEELRQNIEELTRAEATLRESQKENTFLADLLNRSEQPFGVGYPDGRLGIVNGAFERLTGYSGDELRNMDWATALTPPEWREPEQKKLEELHRTGVPVRYEKEYLRKDGSRVPIELLVHLVKDSNGNPLHYFSFITDTTERRRAAEVLRESEDRLRFALETSHTGAWDLDLVDHTASRSLEHDRVFGYSDLLPQWTYEMFLEHVIPEDRGIVDGKFRHAIETKGDWSFECRIRRADGETRWIWAAGRHRPGATGDLTKMAGIVQDITDRKSAEEELQTTLKRFYRILSEMPYGILLVTDEDRVEFANQAFCDMFSLRDCPEDLANLDVSGMLEKIRPAYREPDAALGRIGEIVSLGRPVSGEDVLMNSGRVFLRDYIPVRLGEKKFGRLWIHIDITERRRAEDALREAHARTAAILEGITDTFYSLNREWRFTLVNPAAEKAPFGLPSAELLGRVIWDLYPGLVGTRIHQHYLDAAGKNTLEHYEAQSPLNKRWYEVFMKGRNGGVDVYMRDITKRKKAEDELVRKNDDLNALNEELTATQEELNQNLEELTRREQDLSKALAEKEVLLSEIHHRVKNNLTAFISLLSLEGSTEETPAGKALKLDLQNRARSMAIIHETLYRTHMYDEVDMGMYLTTLLDQIATSFRTVRQVKIVVDAPGVMLDIPRATPAGLIVNELVTNSFKYAFPDSFNAHDARDAPPTITVALVKDDGMYTMTVSDNGVGLPAGFDLAKTQTLGLKLVNFLAKHQMRAKVEVRSANGTEFVFRFKA